MTEMSERFSVVTGGGAAASAGPLDPRVVDMYTKVGEFLSRYRSGKLPKAFKIMATLSNWEEVLFLTKPEKWTASAMYHATRLFASNMNAHLVQRCALHGPGSPLPVAHSHCFATDSTISCCCRACATRFPSTKRSTTTFSQRSVSLSSNRRRSSRASCSLCARLVWAFVHDLRNEKAEYGMLG
jgi:hypothetical protein